MDEGVDPKNMCRHLYSTMGVPNELLKDAPEDLIFLFQDWLDMVASECRKILAAQPDLSTLEVAKQLKLPVSTVEKLIKRGN